MKHLALVGAAVTVTFLAAPAAAPIINVHGTVHFIDVEGGCWQFEDDAGDHYEPILGPSYLYCDGSEGRLIAFPRPDLSSICQVGELVQVLHFKPDTFTVHGVMRFIDVEGGCWQFQGDDGVHYEPMGGPPGMYQDGAAGSMTAFDRCLVTSTCMVGRLVQVVAFRDCSADLDGDGAVGVSDLLLVLAGWGPCPPPCAADVDGNGAVGIWDLLMVLAGWGPCP